MSASTPWRLPTLHEELREYVGDAIDGEPLVPVRCPCGRDTHLDLCIDLMALPADMRATIRTALDLPAARFICCACRSTVFREQLLRQEEVYVALGAPEHVLAVCREHDARHRAGERRDS